MAGHPSIISSGVWIALAVFAAIFASSPTLAASPVTSWDLDNDFMTLANYSTATNPNGAWSYGCMELSGSGLPTGKFHLLSSKVNQQGWNPCWYLIGTTQGTAWKNGDTKTEYGCPPGQVSLESDAGATTTVRWTAPVAGTFLITGSFGWGDGYPTYHNTAYRSVFVNTTEVVRDIAGSGPFAFQETLAAGDLIDFVVWGYPISGYGNIPVTATITSLPVVTTGSAGSILSNGATLNGTANPNGLSGVAYFEYGATASYGNVTTPQTIGSGTAAVSVSAAVSGLTANTIYHFRIDGSNGNGVAFGSDQTFSTPLAAPPMATTGSASGILSNAATINATLNPNGLATSCYFQYGTTSGYGSVTSTQFISSGSNSVAVSDPINALAANTVYHFRVVASRAGGATNGADHVFATAPPFMASGWSDVVFSTQDNTPPFVGIISPADQSYTTYSSLVVLGTSSDLSGVKSLAINGKTPPTVDGFVNWKANFSNLKSGSNAFTIVASDNAVPPNTTILTLTINGVAPTSTAGDGLPDDWQLAHGLDPTDNGSVNGNNGPLGNPAGDGVSNLMKYALNLDPQTPLSGGLPVTSTAVNPADSQTYLMFTYNRRLAAIGITYFVEVTSDLTTWTTDPAQMEELAPPLLNLDGVTESVTVRLKPSLDTPGQAARFVRLRVTAP